MTYSYVHELKRVLDISRPFLDNVLTQLIREELEDDYEGTPTDLIQAYFAGASLYLDVKEVGGSDSIVLNHERETYGYIVETPRLLLSIKTLKLLEKLYQLKNISHVSKWDYNAVQLTPLEVGVNKVVEWWIDKSFRTKVNQNNGDDSPSGGFSFALINQAALIAQDTVTESQIAKFRSLLRDKLLNYIPTMHGMAHHLDVDYHPDHMLAEVCEESGANPGCLPCKTWTRIYADGKVEVSMGYGTAATFI